MAQRIQTGLVAALIMSLTATAAQHVAASELPLIVLIYDYTRVNLEMLTNVENTTSKIFRHAGIQLVWRDGFAYVTDRLNPDNLVPLRPAAVIVKLEPQSKAARYGVGPVCGGIGFESGAIVFVPSFDRASTPSSATRLSYVMAHELGHILLGSNAHSLIGIMRRAFLQEDWAKAAQGTLGFTHSQNQQIRAWATARSRSSSGSAN
jgi:hypothetical protein